jgi:small basic protein (TIGR04137 family)
LRIKTGHVSWFSGVKKMTQHRSLKSADKITVKRNVLKRFERVDIMRERGTWKEGDSAFGLPKTKSDR